MQIESHHSERRGSYNAIVVERIDYPNPYDFKQLHRHEYFEFLLFERGNGGTQIIDFKAYTIESKTMYLVLPGQVHLMKRSPNENGMLIQFSKSAMIQSIAPYKVNQGFHFAAIPQIKLNDDQFETLHQLFRKIEEIHQSNTLLRTYKLIHILGLILLEILELIAQQKNLSPPNNSAYQFLNAVEKHFKKIQTVKGYAKLLNIPINKLTQKVKTHFGKAPLQIIHEMLLVEIKRLMVVEQLSHKEISFELNFDSQSSYSRFVKKYTSLSPSLLKEQLNQIAQ